MNPSDLIHSAKRMSESAARSVWYFHSRYVGRRGLDKVAGEIAHHSAVRLSEICTSYYQQATNPDYKPGIGRDELLSAIQQFCTLGIDAPLTPKLQNIFSEFVESSTAGTKQNFCLTNIGNQVWGHFGLVFGRAPPLFHRWSSRAGQIHVGTRLARSTSRRSSLRSPCRQCERSGISSTKSPKPMAFRFHQNSPVKCAGV